jgi:hypothetical protein
MGVGKPEVCVALYTFFYAIFFSAYSFFLFKMHGLPSLERQSHDSDGDNIITHNFSAPPIGRLDGGGA